MSREVDGVMKTCVVLTYVDDLLVVGDAELQAEVSSAIAARFPVTKGGSDYLGMRITQATGRVTVDGRLVEPRPTSGSHSRNSFPVVEPRRFQLGYSSPTAGEQRPLG
jgi:hypothetical protein